MNKAGTEADVKNSRTPQHTLAKRWRRSVLLLIAGFLAFAPPGTLILGTAVVLGLVGKFFGSHHDTQEIARQSVASSPVASTASSVSNASSGTSLAATQISDLRARLEAALPPQTRYELSVTNDLAAITFVLPETSEAQTQAQQYAYQCFGMVFTAEPPFNRMHFVAMHTNGEISLALRLNAKTASLIQRSRSVNAPLNPSTFLQRVTQVNRSHDEQDVKAYVSGRWAD